MGKLQIGYILFLECPNEVVMHVKSLGEIRFRKNMYVYVGSANLRNPIARVLRHFSKCKKKHWHIDYLTEKCDPFLALLCFGCSEDHLYEMLESFNNVKPAVLGFGSTDKAPHKTHLFEVMHRGNQVIKFLFNTLVKTCDCVDVISVSREYCFSQALLIRP